MPRRNRAVVVVVCSWNRRFMRIPVVSLLLCIRFIPNVFNPCQRILLKVSFCCSTSVTKDVKNKDARRILHSEPHSFFSPKWEFNSEGGLELFVLFFRRLTGMLRLRQACAYDRMFQLARPNPQSRKSITLCSNLAVNATSTAEGRKVFHHFGLLKI